MVVANAFSAVLIFIAFGVVTAQIDPSYNGSCPNFNYLKNINYDKLQGSWYVQYQPDNGTSLGCDGNCWTFFWALKDSYNYNVDVCCQQCSQPLCGRTVGTATVTINPTNPGVFTTYTTFSFRTYVLYAEYNSFAIIVDCYPETPYTYYNTQFTIPIVYIVTRTPRITAAVRNRAFKILADNGLDSSALLPITHNNQCNYFFNPPK